MAPSAAAVPLNLALQSGSNHRASLTAGSSAADKVLEAELQARGDNHDALSMMMSSMVRMVQAGQTSQSRWKDA
jgi:23S rRNA maturation-related 3'-5' exoribonuclease YhaM